MAKIKVGIRYCGGCNPSFDRVEAVRSLSKALNIGTVRYDQPGVQTLLLICGCPKACPVDDQKVSPSIPHMVVTSNDDMESARLWLMGLMDEGG